VDEVPVDFPDVNHQSFLIRAGHLQGLADEFTAAAGSARRIAGSTDWAGGAADGFAMALHQLHAPAADLTGALHDMADALREAHAEIAAAREEYEGARRDYLEAAETIRTLGAGEDGAG